MEIEGLSERERGCAALMRGGSAAESALLHLRSLRSLESPHTKLKITCHRKIRHHQVHTQRAAVCAHYYPQLCAVAATPCGDGEFRFFDNSLLSRGAVRLRVRV